MRCPNECDKGRLTVTGVHPSSRGAITTLESPDEWEETCPLCRGTGEVEPDDAEDGSPFDAVPPCEP